MRRWLSLAAKLAMTALLFWLLLRKIDLAAAWARDPADARRSPSPPRWPAAGRPAFRLRPALADGGQALGAHLDLMKATAVFAIGTFFGLVLPGAVGGDVVRMWTTHRAGLPLAASRQFGACWSGSTTVLALVLLVDRQRAVPGRASAQRRRPVAVPGADGRRAWRASAWRCCSTGCRARCCDWRLVRGLARLAGDTRRLYLAPGRILPVLAVAVLGHINLGLTAYAMARGLHIEISLFDAGDPVHARRPGGDPADLGRRLGRARGGDGGAVRLCRRAARPGPGGHRSSMAWPAPWSPCPAA